MSAKKRCAQDGEEVPMAAKPEDVLREIADNGASFEALTIQEMVAAPLPIVVVPFPAFRHPFDFQWRVGFPAGYVTGIHLRMELSAWLCGTGELDLVAFVLKCGYITSIKAINNKALCLPSATKWSRLVDFLCVIHAMNANLTDFYSELKHMFSAPREKDSRLLAREFAQLTVDDVMGLVQMPYDVKDSELWSALCASLGRLCSCLKLPHVECLTGALKVKLGTKKFPDLFSAQHADGPERDQRIPYCSKYGVTWD